MAELWGLFEGVKLLHSRGILKVEVNIDFTKFLKAIERRGASVIESLSLINRICKLFDNLEVVVICHAYRETNKYADVLTSVGCRIDMIIFYIMPYCIEKLLEKDAKGVSSVRLVTV